MKTIAQFRDQAVFLRESSGFTNIEKTLLKALNVLKLFNIRHYVCGGFAVQELGYPRFTVDVDIIMPEMSSKRGIKARLRAKRVAAVVALLLER